MGHEHGDSAGPPLRGFRLQILYTLARLTEPQTELQATLWPEGIEDLAILGSDGELREAIQVKGHTAPLPLSELIFKTGRGLLRRAVNVAREHPVCKIRLVSFGPIGQELLDAWNGTGNARERVVQKLKRAGLSSTEITLLFSRLTLEQVNENAVNDKVHNFLSAAPALVGQPDHAAAILCHWLYDAAERRERITYADLIARLTNIGRYIHARAGYWRDWFSVIEPLDQTTDLESQRERLSAQFQQGMSARFEHILADCDVPRNRWLEQITQGFSKENVVIVHGASGQGKSALAYRWLHEETPDLWRFEVKLVDTRRDALQIATALSGHARAVGTPMTIYIDARPGDNAWPELVQALARLPQIRVLVTIREEDWRRATLSGAVVAFTDIELNLDEAEAREIYRSLDQPGEPTRFLSFEDAWRRFVGSASNDGPLMEFVYLVTRTETLRERLKKQVNAIRDAVRAGTVNTAELRLLALVAFASALGARLEVTAVRKTVTLSDLSRSVERLEREYLLRTVDKGLLLDGLHPVRSQILADILCDGMTFDAKELALGCLDLIPAQDVEIFLLHFASRHTDLMPALVHYLEGWHPATWAAHGGILRALLWWGVRQYVDQMAGLVKEIRNKSGKAWLVMLDLDIVDLNPPHETAIWKQFDFIPEERKAQLQSFLNRQSPKVLALAPARNWLSALRNTPEAPATEGDWTAIAEMSYWVGRWSVDTPVGDWVHDIELNRILDDLPLHQVADVLLGRWELEGERLRPWLEQQRDRIAARFRKETGTPWIEDQNGTVRAHFLVSWTEITDNGQLQPNEDATRKDRLHAEAIRHVRLLRRLYPDRSGYGCQGYGHHILPSPYDRTTKTSIKPEGLPASWAVRVNGFATGLIDWDYRPAEWSEYLSQIWSVRETMTSIMQDLRRGLVAHFRDKHKRQGLRERLNVDVWDDLKKTISQGIPLPKQAVDVWGFVSEGKASSDSEEQASSDSETAFRLEQDFALAPYRAHLKSQSDLFVSLGNFLDQSIPHLCLHCANGKAGLESSRSLIAAKLREAGGKLISPRLTSHNLAEAVSTLPRFQQEFRNHFSSRLSADRVDEQDRKERKAFESVLNLWNVYVTRPTVHWTDPERRAAAVMQGRIDQIPHRFKRALQLLESEGIRATILKQPAEWENAPALWIALNSENPVHTLTAATLTKPVLRQTVSDAGLNDEQTDALKRRWQHIVILTQFKGRSLNKHAWLLPIYRLTARDASTDFEWLDEIPRPVSDDDWILTGLECWTDAELANAQKPMRVIVRFKALVDHLSGCLTLARTESADHDVLQDYLDRYQNEWSEIIQALVEVLGELTAKYVCLSPEEQAQRPYLAKAAVTIRDHLQDWLPPGLDQGEAVMSVETCGDWLGNVAAHIEELQSVGAAVLVDSMIQATE